MVRRAAEREYGVVRDRKLRTAALLVVTLGIIVTTAPAARAGRDGERDVTLLLQALNDERAASGLRPLQLDRQLCAIAYEHAIDMARRNYFSHATPEGVSPFERMAARHYRFGYAGENLALDESARTIARDFWNSLEHRSNMLGPHYARVGIASVDDPPEGVIVVEDFSD
jgi:uncharacterized protein YkwD